MKKQMPTTHFVQLIYGFRKNAMPATMTTNCSLRLKRRIGGETRNRLKEEEEDKDHKK
jgi:hypothetical protein